MSGGKKKSGFQITSVTSDYEQQQQQQREGLPSPTPPGGGGSGGDAGKKGPGGSSSPRVARGGPAPGEEGDPGGGGGEEEEEGGGGKRANGGGSVSAGGAPNGPSGPPACSGGGGVVSAVSRFRVVKLDQGSGEPYKRGRWTCRDFYEPEAEPLLAAWAAASAAGRLAAASTASDRERQPHSLDSRLEAAAGLLLAKTPQGPFSPQPQRRGPPLATAAAAPAPHLHQPHHHRLLHLPGGPGAPGYCQARSLGGGGGLPGLLRPPAAPPSPGTLRSPLAAPPDPLRPPGAPQEPPSGGDTPAPPPGLIPTLVVEEPRLHNNKSVAQLIRGEADEPRRKVSSPRQSRSRPSSPAPPLFRDASPNRRTSDPFGAARFSLAQSMFGMGVAPHDSDDDR